MPRVLLVDDSEHDRRFFTRLLREGEIDYEIVECENAEAALEKLKEGGFDLLAADLKLPGMDGLELIRQAQPYLIDTGAMMLTGSGSEVVAAEALRLHVLDYIIKEPRDAMKKNLARQVRNAVNQVRLERENRRLERELQLRIAHLEQIQSQMPRAVFAIISDDHVIQEINPQAREMLQVPEGEELLNRPIEEVLGHAYQNCLELIMERLASGEPARNLYLEHLEPDGSESLLLLDLDRVDANGSGGRKSESSWVLTLRDVTPEVPAGSGPGADYHGIIGQDPAILEMRELIRRVAPLPTSVLITGATGSGKEVVARAIHAESDRSKKPFIAVNCTALSSEILESELFGHVRGAFTGAVSPRKGRFREADGGTLLLDEIGDTSESFQTKLLRVLENGEIEPVGQDRTVRVNVRIICATNQNLAELVEQGKFRRDLYYRINVVHIHVASLSERPGDLPLLVERFRNEFNHRFHKSIRSVSQDAMSMLGRHTWPGNVRELRHALEHAFVVAEGPTITKADLPPALFESVEPGRAQRKLLRRNPAMQHSSPPAERGDPRDEVSRIESALDEANGNIGMAANMLNIHRTTLWRKMRHFGIDSRSVGA